VNDVATCPLCSAAFDGGEPYRDHLEQAHGLEDDEGTATVTQLHANRIEDEAAMSLVAEAVLETPSREVAPEPPAVPSSAPAVQCSASAVGAATSTRYLLATRHGDVALYAPGLLMVLIALARLDADVLGLLLLLIGTALVVLGMLLPLVLGRR
jgi:hypothetical protein